MNSTVIPKKIFYIWFGKNKPHWLIMTIYNWQVMLPDFEIIEINEDSEYFDFNYEYNNCEFFKTFYDGKLYALAADYARCKVIYDHGGIYCDTDITFNKDITPLLNNQFFIGNARGDNTLCVNVGIFGAVQHYKFLADIINFYKYEYFNTNLYIICDIFKKFLEVNTYDDFKIYEPDYFYPFEYNTEFNSDCIKENTYCVHWWAATWNKRVSAELLQDKNYWRSKHKKFYKLKKKCLEFLKKIKS